MPQAARFDANEPYRTTISSGSTNTFTVALFGKLSIDKNDYNTFISMDTGDPGVNISMMTDTDGTKFAAWDTGFAGFVNAGIQLTAGTWYFLAMSVSAGTPTFYAKAVGGSKTVQVGTASSVPARTYTRFWMGNGAVVGEYLNGCDAGVRYWSVALTEAELDAESVQYKAVRRTNLVREYYMDGDATEQSGGGVTATVVTGSPTWEAGPAGVSIEAVPRESLDLSVVGSTTWVAGSTSAAPSYPSGLLQNDIVYMVVHNKTTQIPTLPTNFTQVGTTQTIGSGTVGSGTGPSQVSIYRRVIGASPPAGGSTQTVSVTSGNATQATMIAFRYSNPSALASPSWESETVYSGSSAASTAPATAVTVGSGEFTNKDVVLYVRGVTDDTATAITHTSIVSTGLTFGTVTRSPNATLASPTGNQIAVAAFTAPITAGPNSTTTMTVTNGITASETSGVALIRVRAAADSAAAPVLVLPRRRGPIYRR